MTFLLDTGTNSGGGFSDFYFDAWYLSVKTQTKRNFLCPYYMASLGPLIVPI